MLPKCLCSVPKEQMQIMSLVFHICTAPYFALITILFVFCPLSPVPQTNGHFSFILSWRFSISDVMERAGFWSDLNVTCSLSFPSPCSLSLWSFPSLCVREHIHVALPHTTCSNAHILTHVHLTPALSLPFPFLPHSFPSPFLQKLQCGPCDGESDGAPLRLRPDLHHWEDHLCFLPPEAGGAEISSQP